MRTKKGELMTDYAGMLARTIQAQLLAGAAKVYTMLVIHSYGDVEIVTEEIGTPSRDGKLEFVITDIDPEALLAALSEGGEASLLINRIKAGYGERDSFRTLTEDAGEANVELMDLLVSLPRNPK
jgi:hypothetical protein